jgi:hypothetical protein
MGKDIYSLDDKEMDELHKQFMKDLSAGKTNIYGTTHPNWRTETIGGKQVYMPSGAGDESHMTPPSPLWQRLGYGSEQEYIDAGGLLPGIPTPIPTPDPDIPTGTATLPYTVNPLADDLTQGRGGWFYNDGGRVGYAGGGIADLRQGYFIGKLVKKITKPIKKITKSKAGRAALMAALTGYGLKGMGSDDWGLTSGWNLANMGEGIGALKDLGGEDSWKGKLVKGLLMDSEGDFSPWKLGIGAAALYPLIAGDDEEEDENKMYEDWLREKTKWDATYKAIPTTSLPSPYSRNLMGAADGGRIGYAGGYMVDDEEEELPHRTAALRAMYGMRRNAQEGGLMQMADLDAVKDSYSQLIFGKPLEALTEDEIIELEIILKDKLGGPFTQKEVPQSDRAMAQEGGLMDMGGMEKDYRNDGGFVPIGGEERADDVPARLSKNEFVFTADAVRAAGGGDIDAGAEVMENVMENLEKGGNVSEESQGLEGARDMFATSQRLEGVL